MSMEFAQKQNIFTLLTNPTAAISALGFAFLFFDLQYLIMSRLPGSYNEMCVMGAGLNFTNISFASVTSVLFGLFVIGIYHVLKTSRPDLKILSLSGLGALVGSLTVFCVSCTITTLSIFGLAIGLGFLTTYNIFFKIFSLLLMGYGLYKLDQQIMGECTRCVD